MKKILVIFMALSIFFATYSTVMATPTESQKQIIYFENGDYLEIVLEESDSLVRSTTKTGSKTATYKNADDEALWYVKVTGTFTYTGSSCSCTSAAVTAESYRDSWKIYDKSSSYSGNKAIAEATAKNYFLGIVMTTRTQEVTLSCSNTGVLS